jgi:hypothetical protein
MKTVRRFGFRGKNQMPILMVWDEVWHGGEIVHATVVFDSRDWIGI